MKSFLASVLLLTTSLALPVYAGEVKLQLANGRVTLQARDATAREILAEWARVGQVKIFNGEKIGGLPMTLDLQDVPEAQALDTLLRSVSGYMAATRLQPASSGASVYDRIVVLATPRVLNASTNYTAPPQQQQQPPLQYRGGMSPGMSNPAMLDDEEPGQPPTYPGGLPPGYPGAMQRVTPYQLQQPGTAGMQPTATGGVPQGAPGTISPMPQIQAIPGQPGVVVQPTTGAPGTVTPPVRKPGGPGGIGPGGTGGE